MQLDVFLTIVELDTQLYQLVHELGRNLLILNCLEKYLPIVRCKPFQIFVNNLPAWDFDTRTLPLDCQIESGSDEDELSNLVRSF